MIEDLIRPSLRNFTAYSSARSLRLEAKVFLDANELSFSTTETFPESRLNRYPDPECAELRAQLSHWTGLHEQNLFLCSGADQGIDLLIRLFCEPFQDQIAVCEPTYGMYRTCAELQGVSARRLQLNEAFNLFADQILPQLEGVKILFLCSPNNPTGNLLKTAEIAKLLRGFQGLIVIDQAYLEFCAARAEADWSRALEQYENLIVLRTFSKAWGLAAIRLGYVIAQSSVIEGLKRVMPPYPISTLSAVIAQQALRSPGSLEEAVKEVRAERERMAQELQHLPIVKAILPSETNFLFVRLADRDLAFAKLLERGVCVRRRAEPRLRDGLRLTIGTRQENNLLLSVLKEITHEEES